MTLKQRKFCSWVEDYLISRIPLDEYRFWHSEFDGASPRWGRDSTYVIKLLRNDMINENYKFHKEFLNHILKNREIWILRDVDNSPKRFKIPHPFKSK